jgi:hypothetical protein
MVEEIPMCLKYNIKMKHVSQLLAHNIEPGLQSITENIVTIIPKISKHFILELIHCQNNTTQHVTPSSRLIINETKSTTTYKSSTQCY